MPVNSEIFRIYRHLFYGSPLKLVHEDADIYDRHVVIDAFCDRLLERKILMNIISDVESVLEI